MLLLTIFSSVRAEGSTVHNMTMNGGSAPLALKMLKKKAPTVGCSIFRVDCRERTPMMCVCVWVDRVQLACKPQGIQYHVTPLTHAIILSTHLTVAAYSSDFACSPLLAAHTTRKYCLYNKKSSRKPPPGKQRAKIIAVLHPRNTTCI